MLQQFGAVAARPAGAFGAYLGAHDLATPDDLSRFGVHGWRLQRHGRGLAIHDEEQAGAADAFPLGQAKACQDSVAVGLSQFPLRLQPKLQIAAGWSAVDLPQLPGAGSDPFFGSSRG
jgi:hypothetical protein